MCFIKTSTTWATGSYNPRYTEKEQMGLQLLTEDILSLQPPWVVGEHLLTLLNAI